MRRRRERHIESPQGLVVVATAATLRRNVKGERFFPAFDPGRREAFVSSMVAEADAAFGALNLPHTRVDSISTIGDMLMCDTAQSSGIVPEFVLPSGDRAGFVLEGDENSTVACHYIPSQCAITCGIEDHFQLKCAVPTFDPEGVWNKLDALDSALGERVEYAFRRDIGYLTSNPQLSGTGLQMSVYVLPIGLEMLNAAEETMRDLRRRGCVFDQSGSVPGYFSGLCKVSYDSAGGMSEIQGARAFRRAIEELIERELDARDEFATDVSRPFLLDAFSRDLAILKNAYAISSDEAIAKLWTVRAGLDAGYITGVAPEDVENVIGGIRSGLFVSSARNEKDAWDILSDIFSGDDDARDDAEDDIDTIRADSLRGFLARAKVIE